MNERGANIGALLQPPHRKKERPPALIERPYVQKWVRTCPICQERFIGNPEKFQRRNPPIYCSMRCKRRAEVIRHRIPRREARRRYYHRQRAKTA